MPSHYALDDFLSSFVLLVTSDDLDPALLFVRGIGGKIRQ